MSIDAYPLAWPAGRPRTAPHNRERSKFQTVKTKYNERGAAYKDRDRVSISDARKRIFGELERFGARRCVVSSNLELNLDGSIRASQSEPADPGVAAYFAIGGKDYIMACDRWDRAADNLAAIAAHISSLRAQLRYGVVDTRGAFAGFTALPSPDAMEHWKAVFGFMPEDAPKWDDIEARYMRLRSIHHPDKGGTAAQFDRIEKAYAAAFEECGR